MIATTEPTGPYISIVVIYQLLLSLLIQYERDCLRGIIYIPVVELMFGLVRDLLAAPTTRDTIGKRLSVACLGVIAATVTSTSLSCSVASGSVAGQGSYTIDQLESTTNYSQSQ